MSNELLLKAVKMAYRKHHLDDDSIGWTELSDILLIALLNAMGNEEFQRWLESKEWEAGHGETI